MLSSRIDAIPHRATLSAVWNKALQPVSATRAPHRVGPLSVKIIHENEVSKLSTFHIVIPFAVRFTIKSTQQIVSKSVVYDFSGSGAGWATAGGPFSNVQLLSMKMKNPGCRRLYKVPDSRLDTSLFWFSALSSLDWWFGLRYRDCVGSVYVCMYVCIGGTHQFLQLLYAFVC